MKAALNGVLNLSVLELVARAIGTPMSAPDDHARPLYDTLEPVVRPRYCGVPSRMMKEAIGKFGSRFNGQQMMRRYASEAYLR